MLTAGNWPDKGARRALRRNRTVTMAMLKTWIIVAVMQKIAAARMGAVIAGTV